MPWAVLIRGDQDVNEVKLRNHTGGLAVTMLTEAEVTAITGAVPGFAGPVGLPKNVRVVADESVRGMVNVLCGANETDVHLLDVNLGRDCPMPEFADVRLARVGEPGPRTGAPLVERRGIEVGHIFKLGTKYSAAMGCTFADTNGKPQPFVMGCYGIGVSRVAAAAVEQRSDDKGIVWPIPIAPFEVVVAPLKVQDATQMGAAEQIYTALKAAGVDALLDDRKMGAGAKLKDNELMGFSIMVVVGRGLAKDGTVEVRNRTTGDEKVSAPLADAAALVQSMVEAGRMGVLSE